MTPDVPPMALAPADTAWMLVATALVLLMTPGLAFFYGGLVRSKNALNTMMMSFAALAGAGLAWALAGYSLAFAPGSSVLGGFDFALLAGVGIEAKGTIPHLLFMAYQGTFAIITAALVSGAIVERMRFGAVRRLLRRLDAGRSMPRSATGSGAAAGSGRSARSTSPAARWCTSTPASRRWSRARVLGPRRDYGRQALLPHNVPFVLLGAALLWFGWFGFNAGSALAANGVGGARLHQHAARPDGDARRLDDARPPADRPGHRGRRRHRRSWSAWSRSPRRPASSRRSRRSRSARSPRCPCYFGILCRSRTRLDDSLDVVAAHGLGGLTGALLTGVFASAAWGGTAGLLEGNAGARRQAGDRGRSPPSSIGAATWGLLRLLALVLPLSADEPRCRGAASTSSCTARRPTAAAKGRSWCSTAAARPRRPAGASSPRRVQPAASADRCAGGA